jgi:hypothetical protein
MAIERSKIKLGIIYKRTDNDGYDRIITEIEGDTDNNSTKIKYKFTNGNSDQYCWNYVDELVSSNGVQFEIVSECSKDSYEIF